MNRNDKTPAPRSGVKYKGYTIVQKRGEEGDVDSFVFFAQESERTFTSVDAVKKHIDELCSASE